MTLCDVNVYVNAHRPENAHHAFYRAWLGRLLDTARTFAYCEFILGSFVRIVTHPRIYRTPTPLPQAFAFTDAIRRHPRAIPLMPGARHWEIFQRLCVTASAAGNLTTDAYLAALAIECGAEWVTADLDFRRFSSLRCTLLRPSHSLDA